MEGNSRRVSSNQTEPHEKIPELVRRHLANPSKKPINEHTLNAFEHAAAWRDTSRPLIFDSCCGVGESTFRLAKQHPSAQIIGIDKSAMRTDKNQRLFELPDNALMIRADVIDFWRLAVKNEWLLHAHFLLFPNPYPKSTQVQRRWHASSSFIDLIRLGGNFELRSNWQIYVQEFYLALQALHINASIKELVIDDPFTAFERKYHTSGQAIWQLKSSLDQSIS